MANVIYFSVIELLSGFAPTYALSAPARALRDRDGRGVGRRRFAGDGDTRRRRWRGVLSGILQSGYSIGYLLAAVASRVVLPSFGWRWMFWLGALPALLALYIRTKVPESEAWARNIAWPSTGAMLSARRTRTGGFALSPRADDVHDVSVARDAGSLPRFPQVGAARAAGDGLLHGHALQRRRGRRRDHLRPSLAEDRTAPEHDRCARALAAGDSDLGVRRHRCSSWPPARS